MTTYSIRTGGARRLLLHSLLSAACAALHTVLFLAGEIGLALYSYALSVADGYESYIDDIIVDIEELVDW